MKSYFNANNIKICILLIAPILLKKTKKTTILSYTIVYCKGKKSGCTYPVHLDEVPVLFLVVGVSFRLGHRSWQVG